MAALSLASPNQIQSTSGRVGRLSLASALRESAPAQLAELRGYEQDQSRLDQEGRSLALQRQSLALTEEQQAGQQKQATIGTAISGIGTIGTAGVAAKQLGLFGSGTAATTAGTTGEFAAAATPSLATAGSGTLPFTSTAADFAGEGAAATLTGAVGEGAAGTAAGAGGLASAAAPEGFAALGTTGGAVAGAGVAGLGLGVGALIGRSGVKEAAGGGFKGEVAGHAAGAAGGAAVGAAAGLIGGPFAPITVPVGAVIGAISGGLGASFCPIHSAAYGNESLEVAIARRWRDTRLSREQLRSYFACYAPIAARMDIDVAYRMQIRKVLIDPLIRYGAYELSIPYAPLHPHDRQVAETFLERLRVLGSGMKAFQRPSGEII